MVRQYRPEIDGRVYIRPALAAGPLYLLTSFLWAYLLEAAHGPVALPLVDHWFLIPLSMLIGLVASALIGFLPAFFALGLGVQLASFLGAIGISGQLYVVWGLLGGGMAALILLPFNHGDFSWFGNVPFIATGVLCALIARRYVRWVPADDEAEGG